MQIHITFIGLCLFVRDEDGKRVHVLLPMSGGQHRHDPQIFYPGITAKPSSLKRFSLDLLKLHAGGKTQPLPNVLDVEEMVDSKIPKDTADDDVGKKVAVRITLPLADDVVPGETACWEVETHNGQVTDLPLTHQLTWKINDGNICKVDWARKSLAGGGGGTEALGLPIPDPDGVVRIYVLHLPYKVHPVSTLEAPHTQFYYALSGQPGKNPRLKTTPSPPCPQIIPPGEPTISETAYNCMLGKTGAG